jgi:hypothetical protein
MEQNDIIWASYPHWILQKICESKSLWETFPLGRLRDCKQKCHITASGQISSLLLLEFWGQGQRTSDLICINWDKYKWISHVQCDCLRWRDSNSNTPLEAQHPQNNIIYRANSRCWHNHQQFRIQLEHLCQVQRYNMDCQSQCELDGL